MNIFYDIVLYIDSYIHYVCTGNGIGAEGAKGLGEALNLNTTLTTLHLSCMIHK